MRMVAYVTETYSQRFYVDVPDDEADPQGYIEELCNDGTLDATSGGCDFSRHIDAYEDK